MDEEANQIPKIVPKAIEAGAASDIEAKADAKLVRRRLMPFVLLFLVVILVVLGLVIYQKYRNVEEVSPTPTPTPTPTEEPIITPTQTPPPSDGIKLEFTVNTNALARTDGKDTAFSFYAPTGTKLMKNQVTHGQATQNAALNYSIIGSTFRLDIFAPNEVYPVQLDAYFAVGSVTEIGEIFRNGYLTEGKTIQRYFSQIKTEGICSGGGMELKAPCGEPGIYFSDRTLPNSNAGHVTSEVALEGRLVFSCISAQAKSCDDIILSMVIDPAP